MGQFRDCHMPWRGRISVNKVLLKMAVTLLSPAIGQRDTVREFTFPTSSSTALKAADVVSSIR